MTGFKDHFSVADGYGRFRPGYPAELFDYLAEIAPARRLAWDCGTGAGQAAVGLRRRFAAVIATDPSLRQLSRADGSAGNLVFAAARAERAPLADRSVDLATVGQALHWFDFDSFYAEVRRAVRPGGVLAAWTYAFFRVEAGIDRVVDRLAKSTVGAFWPPERRFVDARYDDLPFPFERLETPAFAIRDEWDLERVMGYLGTWSAVNRYRRERRADPLPAVRRELAGVWGQGSRRIRWPLTVLAARVG